MALAASLDASDSPTDAELLQRLENLQAECRKLHEEAASVWAEYARGPEPAERRRLLAESRALLQEMAGKPEAESALLRSRALGLELQLRRGVQDSPHRRSLAALLEKFERVQQEAVAPCLDVLRDRQELLESAGALEAGVRDMNHALTGLKQQRHRMTPQSAKARIEDEIRFGAADALLADAQKALDGLWQQREALAAAAAKMSGDPEGLKALRAHTDRGLQIALEVQSARADLEIWSETLRTTSEHYLVRHVHGDASLLKARPGTGPQPLRAGDAPAAGESLQTGGTGVIWLELVGGHALEIGPRSGVRVENAEENVLTLLHGLVRVHGSARIQIETEERVIEVRGDGVIHDPFLDRSPEEKLEAEVLLPLGSTVVVEGRAPSSGRTDYAGPLRLVLAESPRPEALPAGEPRSSCLRVRGLGP